MTDRVDREIIADLYLSRSGKDFLTELVERFGPRFGGSEQEREAARFIEQRFIDAGADRAWREKFSCTGWKRKQTALAALSPRQVEFECIALPYCPPGEVEGPLVYLGDGHPQIYEENRDRIRGAIVMVTTATPRFYHRSMHRGEKLGRALEAGAAGFIWMRGEPGGLPETGSARFGRACEVPAISVSYETGHEILRLASHGDVRLRIT
ncbi:MAG: PA domain-containing protein, partial [Bacillota bacterium]